MSRALISLQRLYEQVQCCQHSSLSGIMMSQSENWASLTQGSLETSYSTMHGGPHLLLLKKAATKVVRPRSDQGSRYTDKNRCEETED